ncbi:hypothetical protein [Paludisphaera mucosa]|uniref:Uncharacterized protein n=1 Tax=Paludisphaera mucosa TaxID=3030827 RepID=A0ABT6F3N1_9BACT|nr:hypothetical protein [Paludisphaera mucosa]MDG3002181.1 hypothetical protein [Paludisphaera mucosa]
MAAARRLRLTIGELVVFNAAAAACLAILASTRPDRIATYSSVYATILAPVPFFVATAFRSIQRFCAWWASIDVGTSVVDDLGPAGPGKGMDPGPTRDRPHDAICRFLLTALAVLWAFVACFDVPLGAPCFTPAMLVLSMVFVPMIGVYSLLDRSWPRLITMSAGFLLLASLPGLLACSLPSLFSVYGFDQGTR